MGLIRALRRILGFHDGPNETTKRPHSDSRSLQSSTPDISVAPPRSPVQPASDNRLPQLGPDPTGKRITWGTPTPPSQASAAASKANQRNNGNRIAWGGGSVDTADDPALLIGVEDAFEHTPLLAGEKVAFCTIDKVAYHLTTWEFLREQNQGRCCICGRSQVFKLIQLPGTLVVPPITAALTPPVRISSGEHIIGLRDVPKYIGRSVIVQDYVYEVYETINTGTYFVRFEPRKVGDPVFAGFKLVIWPKYKSEWTRQGMRVRDYEGKHIRARGVVQEHEFWGIEILVNSPRVIEIVDGSKPSPSQPPPAN